MNTASGPPDDTDVGEAHGEAGNPPDSARRGPAGQAAPAVGDRATRVARIRAALEGALAPEALDIVDDSARHAGHAGARDGRGHFNVAIVSRAFDGLGPLARHRTVYAALGDLMQTDIHALSIVARAPGEAASS